MEWSVAGNSDRITLNRKKRMKRQPRITRARILSLLDPNHKPDFEFWERIPSSKRFEIAFQLVREMDKLRGGTGEVPRLRKDVCRVTRRKRRISRKPAQ